MDHHSRCVLSLSLSFLAERRLMRGASPDELYTLVRPFPVLSFDAVQEGRILMRERELGRHPGSDTLVRRQGSLAFSTF